MGFRYPLKSEIAEPRGEGNDFRISDGMNLPHPGAGSNRHGESIMVDTQKA
jgi:hypothetical protein